MPERIEFWQGRRSRFHDRIVYTAAGRRQLAQAAIATLEQRIDRIACAILTSTTEEVMFCEMKLNAWSTGMRSKLSLPLRRGTVERAAFRFVIRAAARDIRCPRRRPCATCSRPRWTTWDAPMSKARSMVGGRANDMIAMVNALAAAYAKPTRGADVLGNPCGHTRGKDAEAIRYHYDVSNDFYAAWLDPNMVYSCAYFENGERGPGHRADQEDRPHPAQDPAAARPYPARHRLRLGRAGDPRRAAVRRALRRHDAVGQPACGWRANGCAQAGLEDQVEIRLQDYRDVDGEFDRITSVGMFEHVGVSTCRGTSRKINALLAPGGVVMNHGITTTDVDNGATPYGGGEFIEQLCLPARRTGAL